MTEKQLRQDALYAHAIFDLCGIKKRTRGNKDMSLRLRAHLLAEMAGRIISPQQVEELLQKLEQA